MGRIKTQFIKRITHRLISLYGDKFTDDFTRNKLIVNDLILVSSKKLRNIIAGYITRLSRKSKHTD
jgi:small subunit ribosomal protein S17e